MKVDLFGEDVAVGEDARGRLREARSRAESAPTRISTAALRSDGEAVLGAGGRAGGPRGRCCRGRGRERPAAARAGRRRGARSRPRSGARGGTRAWVPRASGVDLAQASTAGRPRRPPEALEADERLLGLESETRRAARGPARALPVGARPRRDRLGVEATTTAAAEVLRTEGPSAPGTRGTSSTSSSGGGRGRGDSRNGATSRASREARAAGARGARRRIERVAKRSERGSAVTLSSRGQRALGVGVEAAQALDGVAEELDADRLLAIGGKDVQDAAAARELAGRGDRVLAPIAAFVERLEQDLGRHLLARAHAEDARREEARARGSAGGGRRARRRGRRAWPRRAACRAAARRRQASAWRGRPRKAAGPGAGNGRTAPVRPSSAGEGAKVLHGVVEVALARHHEEERALGRRSGTRRRAGPGEAGELGRPLARQRARATAARPRPAARASRRGSRAGGCDRTSAVVERPGDRATRTTRPPRPSTVVATHDLVRAPSRRP